MAATPTILFPRPNGRVPATVPVVLVGTPGASVTVTPDAGSPVNGTIDNSGHIRLMVTFTGTGAHTFAATQTINGSTSAQAGGSLVVPAAGDLYTIPAGATAAQISSALATYHYARLTAGTTYTISQSVIVPSGTYFDLNGSTLRLADFASCYMLRNANEATGDEQIVLLNGVLDGNAVNQYRTFNSSPHSYLTDYCGMGSCFTRVNGLWIDNVTPSQTNSWGHSHWLCDLSLYSNIVCDALASQTPDPETYPGNGDGITGISRRLYVWNVSGYTNDDMVGVATGRVQFADTTNGPTWYEVGVPDIDTDVIDVRNVTAGTKGALLANSGVAIYANGGKTHRHVTIDGLHGTFSAFSYRLTDFWTDDALGLLNECHVLNRTSPTGWLTAGGAQELGFAFNAIAHEDGTIAVTGWKREDETITSVSASGGTVGAVSYPAGDPTTWTCTVRATAPTVTISAQRSGGAAAQVQVEALAYGVDLGGLASGQASATATLRQSRPLSGSAAGHATAQSPNPANEEMAASSAGHGDGSGTLTVQPPLSGSAGGLGGAVGTLRTVAPVPYIVLSATAADGEVVSFGVRNWTVEAVDGTSIGVGIAPTGYYGPGVELSGVAAGHAGATAVPGVLQQLAGTAAGHADGHASTGDVAGTAGGHADGAGTLRQTQPLAGTAAGHAGASATGPQLPTPLSGTAAGHADGTGDTTRVPLAGKAEGHGDATATLRQAQPLAGVAAGKADAKAATVPGMEPSGLLVAYRVPRILCAERPQYQLIARRKLILEANRSTTWRR